MTIHPEKPIGGRRHMPARSCMRLAKVALGVILVLFMLPALATAAWWAMTDRPASWRAANWETSNILPPPHADKQAAIHVLAARTGGMKGAVSVHSWIVIKRPGSSSYERYDKVGWGVPLRRDGWAADGHWYSNPPWIVTQVIGKEAEAILGRVAAAIDAYPFSDPGGYRIWPGPNSNSFVAHVLREVPELNAVLPPNAVGRDYAPGFFALHIDKDRRNLHATLGGLVGFAVGVRAGIEIHFLGLVAGLDLVRPGLKIPALGCIDLPWPERFR